MPGLSKRQNLTTLTNARTGAENAEKDAAGVKPGIPRLERSAVREIKTLHDGKDIIVMGRNKCNGFNSNQYMVVCKRSNEATMINAADDWMDDWMIYAHELGCKVKMCFVQHCHIDDIVNLPYLCDMVNPKGSLQVAWCPVEQCWVDHFPASCRRYKRPEVENATLPFDGSTAQVITLSSATTRNGSLIALGELTGRYIHTPGHSPGHMMLHLPTEKLLFTGDLIHYDGVGRVDLPFALGSAQAHSLRMLEEFSDNTVLLPSHGKLTTLGRERRRNPALIRLYELLAIGKQEISIGANTGPL